MSEPPGAAPPPAAAASPYLIHARGGMAATVSRIRSRSMRGLLSGWQVHPSDLITRICESAGLRRFVAKNLRLCDGLLVEREADRRADRGDDPEAQDDLGLRPALELEVMVDRGHLEDPLAEGLEGEDLDQDRQRLDHEDAAEDDQQHLGPGHHRHARDRAAQAQR